MSKEIWKPIKGYESIYSISNYGRVKSFKADANGRVLKNTNKKGWYFTLAICGLGYKKRFTTVHRVVAEHFVPNPRNLPEVNHIDLDKQNNRSDNLEWVTRKDNLLHAIENNPNVLKGMNHYNQRIKPKDIIQKSLDGEIIAVHINATEASKSSGVGINNIQQVASKYEHRPGRTRKQAGGFKWEYKE